MPTLCKNQLSARLFALEMDAFDVVVGITELAQVQLASVAAEWSSGHSYHTPAVAHGALVSQLTSTCK